MGMQMDAWRVERRDAKKVETKEVTTDFWKAAWMDVLKDFHLKFRKDDWKDYHWAYDLA